jgi:hypothetical protein
LHFIDFHFYLLSKEFIDIRDDLRAQAAIIDFMAHLVFGRDKLSSIG